MARLALTHGEIAVDLASALVETGSAPAQGQGQSNGGMSYVRQVLLDNGVPAAVDREAEVHALWKASVTAAQGRTPRWPYALPTTRSRPAGRPGWRCAWPGSRWSGRG
ncbi:hypothetical protein [Thermocatellispora tengchongensis]|uniref:hypothetical protein n=1 Tax=Thermocatellispora tengchongensis TaxID=1073253 RepID=UPI00362DBA79